MFGGTEIFANSVLLILCYFYIVVMIVVSIKIGHRFPNDLRRKFLHIMIGNFVYVIPFFTFNSFPLNFPFFIASPFILLTFLASPKSPIKIKQTISGLADLTSSGHGFGLFLYAISYSIIAFFFSAQPHVIIAGILPMAFGDAAASVVGQKFGHHRFRFLRNKSLEGSAAMFTISFSSILLSLVAFSPLLPFSISMLLFSSLAVAVVATILEAVTPKGLDNLSVPLVSAVLFLLLMGGL